MTFSLVRQFHTHITPVAVASERQLLGTAVILFIFYVAVGLATGHEPSDFLQYWAAGELWLQGSSPYNPEKLFAVQSLVCPVTFRQEDVIHIWNPPFILPLLAPFSMAPYATARVLWAVLSATAASLGCIGAYLNARLNVSSDASHSMIQYLLLLLALTFSPLHSALQFGQISPFLLFGFVGWLYLFRQSSKPKAALCGGSLLALTFSKPHLLWLVYLIFALKIKQRPILMTCIGATLLICAGSLVALLLVPSLGTEYQAALSHPLHMFKTPTLGSFLYEWTGQQYTVIRLLPTMLGGGGFLWWYARHANLYSTEELIYVAVPWSLLLSPYGWHFDQILLFPSILWCIQRSSAIHPLTGIALTIIAITLNIGVGFYGDTQQGTIWFTVVWAAVTSVVAKKMTGYPVRAAKQEPLLVGT